MPKVLIVLLAGALMIAIGAQDNSSGLPDGPGRDTAIKLCVTGCHPASVLTAHRHSRAEWRAVIGLMRYKDNAPKWTDEEHRTTIEYFHRVLGKINVNIGTKADLAIVLEIPDVTAAAVVKFREKNGPFKTLEDLARVPGLTMAALEPLTDRIAFSGP